MPSGSAAVFSRSLPRAGPVISIGVWAVMRRFSGESTATFHWPSACTSSTTETPMAAMLFLTSSASSGAPEARLPWMIGTLTYSLLTASTVRPPSVNSDMPSLLSPKASSWLSAVPRVAASKTAPFDHSGSPQLTTVCQA